MLLPYSTRPFPFIHPPKNLRILFPLGAAALAAGHGVLHVEIDCIVRQLLSPVVNLLRPFKVCRARYAKGTPWKQPVHGKWWARA